MLALLALSACSGSDLSYACRTEPVGEQLNLVNAMEAERATPRVVDLDWNTHNEIGLDLVEITVSPVGFETLDASVCKLNGSETWISADVSLDIVGASWFPSMNTPGTLSVRDGDTVIESDLYVPIDAYQDAANALLEATLGAEVAEDDQLTEALFELLVDDHVGEVGAEATFSTDQLRPLREACEGAACDDMPDQVALAGTSHPL